MAFRDRMRRYDEMMVGPDLTDEAHLQACMRLLAEYLLVMHSKVLVTGSLCDVDDYPEEFKGRHVVLPARGVSFHFTTRGSAVYVEQLKD